MRADFESSCKGKETRASSGKRRAFKSEMQKETILKAREISIEHLRNVPGRFLAADKNLLQTFHRGIDMERVGDRLDTGHVFAVVREVVVRGTAGKKGVSPY